MFERFTNQARRAIVLAQEEARSLGHNDIGTEHLLLGLLSEGQLSDEQGPAARALTWAGIALPAARNEVEVIVGRSEQAPAQHISFTSPAKKCLELSFREASQLGHGYIGTGHLLLGLITVGEGVAITVLSRLGADLDRLRDRVLLELQNHPEDRAGLVGASRQVRIARYPRQASLRVDTILAQLEMIEWRLSVIERHLGISPEDPADGPGNVVPPS
jgi:ATP-dependent Clp protease ATP-binding subunit ClpC